MLDNIMSIIEHMKNTALNDLIVSAMDDEMAVTTAKLLRCCNEHGVATETVMKIAMAFMEEK